MGCHKKSKKRFGVASGIHLVNRKYWRPGRPQYAYKIKKLGKVGKFKILRVRQQLRMKSNMNTVSKRLSLIELSLRNEKLYTCTLSGHTRLKIRRTSNICGGGYRLVNLDCLQKHVISITTHACMCPSAITLAAQGKSPIKLVSEVRSFGLASVLRAECQGCQQTFHFETSPKLPESKRYDVNVRAVWGSIVTGNGPSHLQEVFGTLNSPSLSHVSFSAIEEEIGDWWASVLEQEMLIAGTEERELAIQKGQFHQGVPAITVVTDGGWSKRSHKHTYNALGGVAIIIGYETKKLLHIGVRNKYCYICSTAEGKKVEPRSHRCYKNWSESSQSMEADIIVEGFKQAESKHGVRYMKLIGDGDSSVFAKVRDEVPIWGRDVTKLECANHTCKCLRSKLEKLVSDNPLYKGQHHLSKAVRVKIVSAVRCAIRIRSNEAKSSGDREQAIRLLRKDIKQSVFHIFGYHENCSDFCKAKKGKDHEAQGVDIPVTAGTLGDDVEDVVSGVMEEQIRYWTEGSSIEHQEFARKGNPTPLNVEKFILSDVSLMLSALAEKSDRLIGDLTTNLAESWMHIRSKFDGGKLFNLCNRSSWQGRCFGGALRMNLGPQWSPKVWKSVTATEPGCHFEELYSRKDRQLQNSVRHKSKPETRKKRWKRKMSSLKSASSKKARLAYGPEAVDVTQDVSTEELIVLKDQFVEKNINLNSTQILAIQNSTKGQSKSGVWHSERKKRLTASTFGSIVRRNPSLKITKFVRNLLYSKFKGTRHTRNGLMQEQITCEEYKLKKAEENVNVTVQNIGLVISEENKFLAGSPDGLVIENDGETGLIEIKNLVHSKPINLYQAAEKKCFCLELINQKLRLRKSHDYYYQCQGLLNICKKPWIDFVVRTVNPYQIHIERIYKDEDMWRDVMLPKLSAFYFSVILPELACPREGKSPGIREPGIWFKPAMNGNRGRKQQKPAMNGKRGRNQQIKKRKGTSKQAK